MTCSDLRAPQAHSKQGYKWWVQRLSRAFQVYDETRIDHFRGFAGKAAAATPPLILLAGA